MTDLVIKQAIIGFDSNSRATSIIVDGHRFTMFPSNTYDSSLNDVKNADIVVQIEIPTGDFSKGGTLPNYTVFHHSSGKRISITGHS